MSNLSDLKAAGGSGKSIDLVASGALANGDKVVLQSDGTVKAISVTTISQSIPLGSVSDIDTTGYQSEQVKFHPTDEGKFVVIWKDSNGYGRAVVGTVSGSSITLGTSVVFSSQSTSHAAFDIDPNDANTFVTAYYVGSWGSITAKSIVGTISGTSLSFGSEVSFATQSGNAMSEKFDVKFDPNTAGKFILTYLWANYPSSSQKILVGEVSSNSISFSSQSDISLLGANNYCPRSNIIWDKNDADKFVITYNVYGTWNGAIYGRVGELTGTSISWGTEVIIESTDNNTYFASAFSGTQGKFVTTLRPSGSGSTAKICTISGTTISVGGASTFNSGTTYERDVAFVPNTETFVIFYRDWSNSHYGTARVGTVSGTSISWSSELVIQNKDSEYLSISFDPNNVGKFIMGFGNSTDGDCEVIFGQVEAGVSNLTATNFIGTSEGAFADTATATVMLRGGITTTQSGLTTGSTYYVQADGTLSTTAGSPSVVAGQAISTTTLLISGET